VAEVLQLRWRRTEVSERGVVKWFSNAKGYGFITMGNGQDAFAHYSDIVAPKGEYKTLDEGMEVEFDILDSDKGPKAINIIKVPAPGVDACP
jgi:CspA family cold shock protein